MLYTPTFRSLVFLFRDVAFGGAMREGQNRTCTLDILSV
jgi:hypothetical protein